MKAVLDAVCREFESVHGRIEGGQIAIVGMGKLGSRELTASSDVDIIVLYSHEDGDRESDGKKPLDAPRYYARLTQRLVAALSSPTAEGVLYDVDLRLRPSGNKGPIASSISAFRKYQFDNAWTWEHMALARARIVTGDDGLATQARDIIDEVLALEREPATVTTDIHDMRKRIEEQKPPESIWDIKLIPGGLIDIEFIAQYLSLIAAANGVETPIAETRTVGILERLAPDLIGADEADTLIRAWKLYTEIMQIVRLCLKENYNPEKVPAAFDDLLLGVVDEPDMAVLEDKVRETASVVRGIFDTVMIPAGGAEENAG
jgi:glutamate-ammonia-ligase adenylyltransferase